LGKEIADAAITFLKTRDTRRPFFAYLAFANPHDPRVVIRQYRDRYDEVNVSQLFNLRDDPEEMRNLCDARPEKIRQLWKRLEERQRANGDTLPLTVKNPKDRTVTPNALRERSLGARVKAGTRGRG
jgi:arylsulfatase A-like enzyme